MKVKYKDIKPGLDRWIALHEEDYKSLFFCEDEDNEVDLNKILLCIYEHERIRTNG